MAAEPVEVRGAALGDAASLHACMDAVARERRYIARVEAPALEFVRQVLAASLERGIPRSVAAAAGQVVGWCDIFPQPYEGMQHCGVLGMGVVAHYRRRGLGARLLDHALGAARRCGLRRVELEAFSSNGAALALYERAGFALAGCKRRARSLDGSEDDIICMAILF